MTDESKREAHRLLRETRDGRNERSRLLARQHDGANLAAEVLLHAHKLRRAAEAMEMEDYLRVVDGCRERGDEAVARLIQTARYPFGPMEDPA